MYKKEEKIMFIGDVHGKLKQYHNIIKNTNLKTVQVGDFGFKNEHEWHLKHINSNKHKVLFGNHDDPNYLNYNHSLGDFYSSEKFFSIRGADSVDKYLRTEGIDWWREEQLTYNRLLDCLDLYVESSPRIVVSHDCPQQIRKDLFGISEKSTTSNGLQAMFDSHKPDIWVFGHHHKSKDVIVNGTRFICLAELETIIL